MGAKAKPSREHSLSDTLERIYENQLALEAALMELTLVVESQGNAEVGGNVRGALDTIGENSGHIKQGLARLRVQGPH
ncbi:hypothetical protein [Pseudomonas rhodesiae]|uniref:hypothetical protein n=1 Tax=Pseudomonas rhodesiae TaxID=76760 RepID=UPI001F3B7F2E|nr:hypothetical protein [Pseudomonas rhodesiae]